MKWCYTIKKYNRKNKSMITNTEIENAAERIAGRVRTTPIVRLERGIWGLDGQLVLKLEQIQHTGSFKPRGAFNRILSHPVPDTGVIAASGGNHGLAVAYAAQQLGYRAEIFVPESCPAIKVEKLRYYGADVHIVGSVYAEALIASETRAAETGALVVHAYDQSFGIDRTNDMNVSAIVAQLLHLDGGTGLRHKYLCSVPQLLRSIGHCQPVIAARCRNHAGVWHGMGENAVEGAAWLERSRMLYLLQFEYKLPIKSPDATFQTYNRRCAHASGYALSRVLNLSICNH